MTPILVLALGHIKAGLPNPFPRPSLKTKTLFVDREGVAGSQPAEVAIRRRKAVIRRKSSLAVR
jgi:hypothetical protein